jgi:hypothetical protein
MLPPSLREKVEQMIQIAGLGSQVLPSGAGFFQPKGFHEIMADMKNA